jgi:hypothetical protein
MSSMESMQDDEVICEIQASCWYHPRFSVARERMRGLARALVPRSSGPHHTIIELLTSRTSILVVYR